MRALVSLGLWLALILVKVNGKNIHGDDSRPGRSQIVGGSEVTPHSFPWQVGISKKHRDHSFCGGTIICPNFILTAGHCVEGESSWGIVVMVGDHKQSATEASERRHEVKKFYVHDKYYSHEDPGWCKYDYAILELKKAIKFKKEARPIFLPEKHEYFDSRTLFVASGWGLTDPSDIYHQSDVLKSITLPWVSDKTCSKALKERGLPWSRSMVCAGDLERGQGGACSGDSGGPLAWLDPETEHVKIIGMASFVRGDCGTMSPYFPEVFADVERALGWINDITRGCNQKSCRRGECVTKDKLDESAIDRFEHI